MYICERDPAEVPSEEEETFLGEDELEDDEDEDGDFDDDDLNDDEED